MYPYRLTLEMKETFGYLLTEVGNYAHPSLIG